MKQIIRFVLVAIILVSILAQAYTARADLRFKYIIVETGDHPWLIRHVSVSDNQQWDSGSNLLNANPPSSSAEVVRLQRHFGHVFSIPVLDTPRVTFSAGTSFQVWGEGRGWIGLAYYLGGGHAGCYFVEYNPYTNETRIWRIGSGDGKALVVIGGLVERQELTSNETGYRVRVADADVRNPILWIGAPAVGGWIRVIACANTIQIQKVTRACSCLPFSVVWTRTIHLDSSGSSQSQPSDGSQDSSSSSSSSDSGSSSSSSSGGSASTAPSSGVSVEAAQEKLSEVLDRLASAVGSGGQSWIPVAALLLAAVALVAALARR